MHVTTVGHEPVEHFLRRHLAGDFLLWSPNIQSEAYLNWQRIWATRTIPRGTPRPLPRAPRQLDLTFPSRGTTCGIDDLMRREFVSGLLVVKDGEIRLERYARGLTPETTWQSSSMVKSLASILVGAAVHDGSIGGIDDPITGYLPELAGTAYEGVTVRHLLQMTSGVLWTESTDDRTTDVTEHYIKPIAAREPGHILDYLATRPRVHEPGTQMFYNSGDTFLLSHLLTRATGRTVAEYCSEKLWKPMGCEQDGYFMLDSDDGFEVVGSCAGATLRDYARWGLFMLADGFIDGRRLLPEGWVTESTAPTAPGFEDEPGGGRPAATWRQRGYSGYGYLWWVRPGGDFQASGSFGQWIYVSPEHDAVVVILGAVPRLVYMTPEETELHRDTSHGGSQMRWDFIQAALQELGTTT